MEQKWNIDDESECAHSDGDMDIQRPGFHGGEAAALGFRNTLIMRKHISMDGLDVCTCM